MNKAEYMNVLRQALEGLPAATIEETMWSYEKTFLDAMVAGRSEADIAAGLPEPGLVAAQKRASLHMREVKENFSIGNLARLAISLMGLLVFNFFMIVPAIAFFSLLFATYLTALGLYVGGIGMTAASLSGVQQFSVQLPAHHHHVVLDDDDDLNMQVRGDGNGEVTVDVTPAGVVVERGGQDVAAPSSPPAAVKAGAPAASVVASAASGTAASAAAAGTASAVEVSASGKDQVQVRVANHLERPQAWRGIGMLLSGIALFMLALFATKYSFLGFKRYVQWNVELLRQPAHA